MHDNLFVSTSTLYSHEERVCVFVCVSTCVGGKGWVYVCVSGEGGGGQCGHRSRSDVALRLKLCVYVKKTHTSSQDCYIS